MTREAKKKKIRFFDYSMLFVVVFLLCFGMVMLYSTSAYTAQEAYGNPFKFVQRQGLCIGIGTVAVIALIFIGIKWMDNKIFRIFLMGLSYALCLYVIFKGETYGGSSRWIQAGPISFQPSEIAKVSIIVFLASALSKAPQKYKLLKNKIKVMILPLGLAALIAYSNLSTGIIVVGIIMFMVFTTDFNWKQFSCFVLFFVAAIVLYIVFKGYRSARIAVWRNPESDMTGLGYQTLQGLYAIGSGGALGKGLGNGIQKLGPVPEAENDMIFSIICEELGLFGAVCVVILFALLLWRMMVIASNAVNLYSSLVVVGVFAQVAIQVILNIAVVTNIIPNTGVALPFISYGGTSITILMVEMGMVLAVSRTIILEQPEVMELDSD